MLPSCRLAFAEQRLHFLAGLRRAAAPAGDPRDPTCDEPLPLHVPGESAEGVASASGVSVDDGAERPQLGSVGTPTAAEAVLADEVARLARERTLLLHRLEVRPDPYHTPVHAVNAACTAACIT